MSEDDFRARFVDPTDAAAFSALLDHISDRRVIYVGEIHDRYDHHQNQLAVVRGLQERGIDLAIGMEYFQEPFQAYLDDYVGGRLDEKGMLRKTEYYGRWRYDFRLYRDILEYARRHRLPLVALNAPGELVDAVSTKGIEGLSPEERARLPALIEPVDASYEKRLRDAFSMHGNMPEERFQRFMEVQTTWDEYMARRAADYLRRHPDKALVVLVGAAHVLHDAAIPKRLRRYQDINQAVIVTKPFEPLLGVTPDYVLASQELELERRGRMGMTLQDTDTGVRVASVKSDSPAYAAGFRAGDRILRMDGEHIAALGDVRLTLHDRGPGERLTVHLERSAPERPPEQIKRVLRLL
ncbi:MAG: ChaN family lipoprotein [Pseudomonadota bacterium]|nr:ChaN family lipoprotein [Pseudomonadota bacterium]